MENYGKPESYRQVGNRIEQMNVAKSTVIHLVERTVALKRVRLEIERDGFPITAVREIKILRLVF